MWSSVKDSLLLISIAERKIIYLLVLVRSLLGVLDLVGIFLMGLLLAKTASAATQSTNEESSIRNLDFPIFSQLTLLQLALVALSMFLAKSIFATIFMRIMATRLAKAEIKASKKAFDNLLNADPNVVGTITRSDISFALTYSAGYAITNTVTVAVTILSEAFLLLGVTLAFAIVNLKITIFMGIYFFIIGFVIQRVVGSKFQKAGQEYAESAIDSNLTVESTLESLKEIITLRKQNYFVNQYETSRALLARSTATIGYLSALPRYIVESALMVGAVALAATSFNSNNFSEAASTLGIFLTGGLRIMASMLPLQNALGTLRQQIAQGKMFKDLYSKFTQDSSSEFFEKDSLYQISNQPVGIQLDRISYKYPGSETEVLTDINIQIKPGELIAIIGPSGSGKSTLADLILGLTKPTSGIITRSNENSEASPFAYVPQSPGMIHGTIRENIALGLNRSQVNSLALSSAIEKSHLNKVIEDLKEGLDSKIDAQNNSLSGGQLQRIGLARALYFKPSLLVLDEATSALDAESESAIAQSINELHGFCTVVVVAHRLTTVQNADTVFVVDQGKLIASGKFAELVATNELVAKYVELSELAKEN